MKVRALAVVLIVGLLPTIAVSQSSDLKDPNADLVILGENLFDVAPRDIAEVKVMAPLMDGRYTYRPK